MKSTTWFACVPVLLLCFGATGCSRIRPPSGVRPVERVIEATAYCPCGKCTGWTRTWYGRPVYSYGPNKGKRKEIGVTASGTNARKGTIAADTSRYPFGTVMFIEGYGFGRVEDRGGAIKGEKIDLFFPTHREALEWGRQTLTVKVWFQPAS